DVLRAARPGDAVTGEESGRVDPAPLAAAGRTGEGGRVDPAPLAAAGRTGDGERMWLVDPLCGTRNFAARTMLVAVNVALRTGSEITAAASADPFSGEVFWTDGTAARVRRDGADEPLTPSAESRLVDVNLDPPFPNAPRFRAVDLLADPRFGQRFGPRVVSSTLAVAWVAAGRRAAYVTDGRLRDSVHFAAGIAVCRAAGCVITDIEGQPVHTGVGGLVVAADHETHATLLELMGGFRG
ncbi:inositol monophosphatase family protein, partial [Couchioplanes caeruleus]